MKSKVIEGEMGRGKVWRLEGTGHGYGHDTPRPPSLSLSELVAIRFGRASSVDSTETEFGTGRGGRKGERKSRTE